MNCPNCGTENHEDARFCLKCGASMTVSEQIVPGQAPQPPINQPVPAKGNGVLILVLGILGLVFCPPVSIVAWIMGNTELQKIGQGLISNQEEGLSRAGKILGIIGTIYFLLIFIILAFYIAFAALFAMG